MGKSSDKPVWIHRNDEADLTKLKNLLGLRDGTQVSIPDALGDAIRARVADLEADEVWVRVDRNGATVKQLEQEA